MKSIGIILAGGNNNRIGRLSDKRAIAALPVAGSYRAIDFTLSNMSNSRVSKVAVLPQFNARSLNEHLSSSKWWDFGRKQGGLYVFTPTVTKNNNSWYQGTADALYQNIDFLKKSHEPYVIIATGDGVYKMDYGKVLEAHIAKNADITVVYTTLKDTDDDLTRFGVLKLDENERIVEFEEKPEHPKSNLASMGIYIFNWKLLRKTLLADMKNADSSHDFGKDIIPALLNDEKKLCAYKYKGYWKDVGTIDSLWEANMDLLDKNNALDLNDPAWKIYTEDTTVLPQYVGPTAEIERAFINQGCVINGKVKNSVLFTGARVGEGAQIIDSVLMPGVEVEEGAVVTRALVADGVKIGKNAVVGSADSEHIELVSKRVKGDE